MKQLLTGFAVVAISAAAPAGAQQQPAQQAQQQTAKPGAPDQVICERQEDTGSRLSTHKICHTRTQWAEIRRDDRQAVEHAQSQRPMDYNGH